jgi:hypothetical protein
MRLVCSVAVVPTSESQDVSSGETSYSRSCTPFLTDAAFQINLGRLLSLKRFIFSINQISGRTASFECQPTAFNAVRTYLGGGGVRITLRNSRIRSGYGFIYQLRRTSRSGWNLYPETAFPERIFLFFLNPSDVRIVLKICGGLTFARLFLSIVVHTLAVVSVHIFPYPSLFVLCRSCPYFSLPVVAHTLSVVPVHVFPYPSSLVLILSFMCISFPIHRRSYSHCRTSLTLCIHR